MKTSRGTNVGVVGLWASDETMVWLLQRVRVPRLIRRGVALSCRVAHPSRPDDLLLFWLPLPPHQAAELSNLASRHGSPRHDAPAALPARVPAGGIIGRDGGGGGPTALRRSHLQGLRGGR